jgi:tRNA modification GTPase
VAAQAEVAVAAADAVLFVVDVNVGPTSTDEHVVRMLRQSQRPVLLVANKSDVGSVDPVGDLELLSVSTTRAEGLSALHNWIETRLARDLSGSDFPAITRERHRLRLTEALAAVEAARGALDVAPEMAGDDLRRAADALSRVTGAIGVEDILGQVFATFCIGK